MLFPPPPPDIKCFAPKNTQGVLKSFCINCNQHVDAHPYKWLTGGTGTVRLCPEGSTSPSVAVTPARQSLTPGAAFIASHPIVARFVAASDAAAPAGAEAVEAAQQACVDALSDAEYDAFMADIAVYRALATVEAKPPAVSPAPPGGASVPRSLPGADRATPAGGFKDARQAAYFARQEDELARVDMIMKTRAARDTPAPLHPQPLFDDAYSTPIPYGTSTDLVHPPQLGFPRGRRRLPPPLQSDGAAAALHGGGDTSAGPRPGKRMIPKAPNLAGSAAASIGPEISTAVSPRPIPSGVRPEIVQGCGMRGSSLW
jgi:hypothetical protein